ncbi:MAG: exodeoxyribonuclease VII large subunit [Balneolaceae bacterium]
MPEQNPFAFDIPSVTELTHNIKQILEQNFQDILVEGEISNLSRSRNGHLYFTIKDDSAQLPCVIWRSMAERLSVDIRDGQQVVLGGDIQVYAPHGRYQMIVGLVQQAGIGKLQQKFEELKRKLEQEGLFSETHKKKLPSFPKRIGVITSATGAAFQDIRSTMEHRWPVATLYLHHASVQGLNAAGEIAGAIQAFTGMRDPVDLLIVGRGGGSLEDLWPFNEEIVARAIYNCPIPVISAVGHEVDFSISDFVADARAATPTQAVVIATPDINEIRYQVEDHTLALESILQQKIDYYRDYVDRLIQSHALLVVREKLRFHTNRISGLSEKLSVHKERVLLQKQNSLKHLSGNLNRMNPAFTVQQYSSAVQTMRERLSNRYERFIHHKNDQLQTLQSGLERFNPKAPLDIGFTRILQEGKWIRSKKQLLPDNPVDIEWKDGRHRLG